jgi:hypothetical protein
MMDMEKTIEQVKKLYNHRFRSIDKRVKSVLDQSKDELNLELSSLDLHDVKSLTNTILDIECSQVHKELEDLIAQKEAIESKLNKKRDDLQQIKYEVFDAIESKMDPNDTNTLAKLHQVKLQSIDIFDILSETVESAIITALERSRDSEASEDIEEVVKEITYEAIKEGSLSTIRTRKILSTILSSAIEISEATPNSASIILKPTLKGMRSGLYHSIERFKARIAYMPLEAKHILIEDYDNIMEDLNQTDTLFVQVVQTQANEASDEIRKLIVELNQKMHLDLEELVTISKETAGVIRTKVSNFTKNAVKKADSALKSEKAKEAKAMGIQAWGVAKEALGSAIKSAKNVIDKK